MNYKDFFKHKNITKKDIEKLIPEGVDPKEFQMGVSDEQEHTDNEFVAAKIAGDHLRSDKNYYSKLKNAGLEEDSVEECGTCGCGDPDNDHLHDGCEYDDNGGLPKIGGALAIPHRGQPIMMGKIIQVGGIGGGPANGELSGMKNASKDRGGVPVRPINDKETIIAGGKKIDGSIVSKSVGGAVVPGDGQQQGGPNSQGTIAGTNRLDEGKMRVRKMVKEVLKEIRFDKATGKWVRLDEGGHKAGCTCGFCKNKGNFGKKKDKKYDDKKDKKDDDKKDKKGGKKENKFITLDGDAVPESKIGNKKKDEVDETVNMKMGASYKTVQPRQYKVLDDDFARTNQYSPKITEMYDDEEECIMNERYVALANAKRNLSESELTELKTLREKIDRLSEVDKKVAPASPAAASPVTVPPTAAATPPAATPPAGVPPVAVPPVAPTVAVPPVVPPTAPPVAESDNKSNKKKSSDKSGATSGNSDVRSPTSTSTDVRSPTSTKTSTDAYTAGNVTVTGGAGSGDTEVHITQVPSNTSDAIKGRNITPEMKRAEMAIDNEGDPSSMDANLGKDSGGDSAMKAKLGKSDVEVNKTLKETLNMKMGSSYKTVQPRQYKVASDDFARTNQYDPEITEMFDDEKECMMNERYVSLVNAKRNLSEAELSELKTLREKIDRMAVAKRNFGLSQGGVEPNIFEGRCEDWPCCGHEAGDCPSQDAQGNEVWKCAGCGGRLPRNSSSSLCKRCLRNMHDDPDGDYERGNDQQENVDMKMGPSYKTVQPTLAKTAGDDFARTNQYDPQVSEGWAMGGYTQPQQQAIDLLSRKGFKEVSTFPNQPDADGEGQDQQVTVVLQKRGRLGSQQCEIDPEGMCNGQPVQQFLGGVNEAGGQAVQHSSYRTVSHGNLPQVGKQRWANDLDEGKKKPSKVFKSITKGQKPKKTQKNPHLKFQHPKKTHSGVHKRKT